MITPVLARPKGELDVTKKLIVDVTNKKKGVTKTKVDVTKTNLDVNRHPRSHRLSFVDI